MDKANNGPKKILVVDDERNFLKMVALRLESSGYMVVKLDSGARVMEVAKADKPDLILLDTVMPGKNGCDVCRELKTNEATRGIPVIMFTAHYPEKAFIDINSKEFGADDYLTKPYEVKTLLDKIDRLIR